MKKAQMIAPLVCVVGLLVAGCKNNSSDGAASGNGIDVSNAAANTLETSGPAISFATVDYSRENPNFIAPCFFVIKGLRQASLANDKFTVDYKISYTSRGQQVTKTVTKQLSEAVDHVHETPPDKKSYIALAHDIDVSDAIPDEGTSFTGTATLNKKGDGSSIVVVGTSELKK